MLGSTYVARGVTTKGWLLTGYALRMVYDLGLHIDRKTPDDKAIEEEVRKRIFWGAFVCDKLQSLYLGRPFAIKLRDAHVSLLSSKISWKKMNFGLHMRIHQSIFGKEADPNIRHTRYPVSRDFVFSRRL